MSAPTIFSPRRRYAARVRGRPGGHFLAEDVAEDVIDRLAFLREPIGRALVAGPREVGESLRQAGWDVTELPTEADDESPLPFAGFDLVVSAFRLEVANDLPGALIHLRRTQRPGGLLIAAMTAAGSLAKLRRALAKAEGDRPALRIHPQVDVRAGGQLLQRSGLADPVADGREIRVNYRSIDRLVDDLRAMGMSSQLTEAEPLSRAAWQRTREAFDADPEPETFAILTLSGRAPA